MTIWTEEADQRLRDYLATHDISKGLGTKEAACSVAAINLAINGRLTDDIPECMSLVIGRWIIRIQDLMPSDIRNSEEWKDLLPLAAGSGRKKESERLELLKTWIFGTVLPVLQSRADQRGFGEEWATMLTERTIG